MKSAYASSTSSNLKTQWTTYWSFLEFFNLSGLPATHKVLSLYATLLARSFKSPQSVRNYISGVKTLHSILDYPIDQFNHPQIRLTLKGIERTLQHQPKRASPITPQILKQIYHLLDHSKPIHTTYWALCTTAFFTMSRKSNMIPTDKLSKIDHHIRRSDISISTDHALIRFNSSKTNQMGNRTHLVPIFALTSSPLCPVRALSNMIQQNPTPPHFPAFTFPNLTPLYYQNFQSFIKSAAVSLHLPPSDFSSHSFRRGGATLAFQSKVSPELIKEHGDWRSDAYLIYLEYSFQQKLSVSKQMANFMTSAL